MPAFWPRQPHSSRTVTRASKYLRRRPALKRAICLKANTYPVWICLRGSSFILCHNSRSVLRIKSSRKSQPRRIHFKLVERTIDFRTIKCVDALGAFNAKVGFVHVSSGLTSGQDRSRNRWNAPLERVGGEFIFRSISRAFSTDTIPSITKI
jgi:hypothetical protein